MIATLFQSRYILAFALLLNLQPLSAQEQRVRVRPPHTVKPVVMGREYAVSSMMPQASMAAQRILEAGGNAFDAAVGGQAVLGLVSPAANGVGSDAMLLVYDAKLKKVWSINAEGAAPKLATIEWYEGNQHGKIPSDETLLAATVPGVIDAWCIMLSRWGTKSLEAVLGPAFEVAEGGVALSAAQASQINNAQGLGKYPTSRKLYQPDGKKWQEGDIFKNLELARTFHRLIEAERKAAPSGRQAGLQAARDCFYKGDIAREMAQFSEENGGLFRYEDCGYQPSSRSPFLSTIAAMSCTKTLRRARVRPNCWR